MNGSRWWAALLVLLAAAALEYGLPQVEAPVPHASLQSLPMAMAGFTAQDFRIEPRLVAASSVDAYLNRIYRDASGNEVGVYVGYYKNQRAGDSVHSPKNCFPGAGWQAVSSSKIVLPLQRSGDSEVNLYIVENEQQRFVVLYWYESHGRIIASEYSAKYFTVRDAILLHRTDSAMVRITVPAAGDEARARRSAIAFAIQIAPQLDAVIPR